MDQERGHVHFARGRFKDEMDTKRNWFIGLLVLNILLFGIFGLIEFGLLSTKVYQDAFFITQALVSVFQLGTGILGVLRELRILMEFFVMLTFVKAVFVVLDWNYLIELIVREEGSFFWALFALILVLSQLILNFFNAKSALSHWATFSLLRTEAALGGQYEHVENDGDNDDMTLLSKK